MKKLILIFFAMALNDVLGLLLPVGMTSCDLDAKSSVCRPQAAASQQCQSVATGPAGSAPGPTDTLASLAESKQNTNDRLKACLTTDIMWINGSSAYHYCYNNLKSGHRDRPTVHRLHTRAWPLQQQKAAELQQERASRQSPKSTDRPSGSRTRRLDPSSGPGLSV
jgi:hypothetical protein